MALRGEHGVTSKRASEAERERVLRALREAAADGRLSQDTFVARLDHALALRGSQELADLVVDLRPQGRLIRVLTRATAWFSLATVEVRRAWRGPRMPELMLPSEGAATVGRAYDCDCRLADPTVSRRHAILRRGEDGWVLADLGSSNGTRVNGWRVVRAVAVRPGDHVEFGSASFQLRGTASSADPVVPDPPAGMRSVG